MWTQPLYVNFPSRTGLEPTTCRCSLLSLTESSTQASTHVRCISPERCGPADPTSAGSPLSSAQLWPACPSRVAAANEAAEGPRRPVSADSSSLGAKCQPMGPWHHARLCHGCSRWVVSGTIQAHSFPLAAVQPYQARLLQQVVRARSQLPAVDSTASAARSMCSSGSSSSTSLIFQALQLLLRHATPATSSTACSQHAPAAPSCQQQLHQHRITAMQQPCGAGHSKQQRRATAHRCQICHASTCSFLAVRDRCCCSAHHISIQLSITRLPPPCLRHQPLRRSLISQLGTTGAPALVTDAKYFCDHGGSCT